MTRPPSRRHPATWSAGQLDLVADLLHANWGTRDPYRPLCVLDPMAGEGGSLDLETLLMWRGRSVTVHCSDITAWPHARPGVAVADTLKLPHSDATWDAVAASIPYGNRMADTQSTDGDSRATYADRRGCDAGPTDASGMQWGSEFRATMSRAIAEWSRVLRCDGLLVLACKDHIRDGQHQQVCAWLLAEMRAHTWQMHDFRLLRVPGVRGVGNAEARVPVEMVMCCQRAAPTLRVS